MSELTQIVGLHPQTLLWGILAAVVLGFGGYVVGRVDGRDIEVGKEAKIGQVVQSVRDASLQGAADAIAKIEVKNVTIKQPLQTEIRTQTVYTNCVNTPDGLRLINAALSPAADANIQPVDSGKLPESNAPK